MSMTLHTLQRAKRKRKTRKGRGNASGSGTYSGRGQKGQRSRSGGRRGIQRRSLKSFYQRVPKRRGFTSIVQRVRAVNLRDLDRIFPELDTIRLKDFHAKGVLTGSVRKVKVLGRGKLSRAVTVFAHSFSKTAREAIEQAGGKAELVLSRKKARKASQEKQLRD